MIGIHRSDGSIAILCREKSAYGGLVVDRALREGLKVSGVILQRWGRQQRLQRFRSYVRRGHLLSVLFSIVTERLDSMFLADSSALQRMPVERVLEERSVRAFHVPTLNGAATLHCLAEISPDLLLLGGVGLVSSELIRRVANRVLNAHPAVLPQYRGSYVVRWALLRGDPLAVTVHLVDAGIDTGAVLSVTRCNTPQTGSLLQIEHHMQQRQASLLVQEAAGFLSGKLQPVPQAADALHPPYSVMPPMQLLQVYQMLRRGNLRRGV